MVFRSSGTYHTYREPGFAGVSAQSSINSKNRLSVRNGCGRQDKHADRNLFGCFCVKDVNEVENPQRYRCVNTRFRAFIAKTGTRFRPARKETFDHFLRFETAKPNKKWIFQLKKNRQSVQTMRDSRHNTKLHKRECN